MTVKYSKMRIEIFERNSNLHIRKNKTIKEIFKMIRRSYWGLILVLIVASVSPFILWRLFPQELFYIIPLVIIYLVSIIGEVCGEKIYNADERKKIREEDDKQYSYYIAEMQNILVKNGIDTIKKREMLKNECKERLKKHETLYNSAIHSTVNMLIGVPLGALISSIISDDIENVVRQIIGLVTIGCFVIEVLNFIKMLKFYSEGYFKDRLLLCVLNELEYHLEK